MNSTLAIGLIGLLVCGISEQKECCVVDASHNQCIQTLVKAWDEYKASCYGDSTAKTVDVFLREGKEIIVEPDIDPGFYPGYQGSRVIWQHRKPTLDGFIQFLRNKWR